MSFSVVVILYNSCISNSTTLQSILNTELSGDLKLYIWNNGPHYLDKTDIDNYVNQASQKGILVEIYQDIRNIALSKVYNFIANKAVFDFFIPLDQDTRLNKSFFNSLNECSIVDLVLPIVHTEGQSGLVKFPFNTKTKQPILEQQAVDAKIITSVTSAMAISKHLAQLFKKNNLALFDECFAFYGIDTAFFFNIHKIAASEGLTCWCHGQIEHSLSTYVQENKQASYRRNMEFLYYAVLYRLNYKNKSRFSTFFYVFSRILKGRIKDFTGLKNILYCIIHKKHPRSALDISEN